MAARASSGRYVARRSSLVARRWLACLVVLLAGCGLPGLTPATSTPPPTATALPSPTPSPTSTPVPLMTATPAPPAATATATRVAFLTTSTAPRTTPTAPARLSPTAPPTPRPTSRPGAATATPAPTGGVPAGWPIYPGGRLPFEIAYPPGWRVDESELDQGRVYFRAPDPMTWLMVGSAGVAEPDGNIDVLRDREYRNFAARYPGATLSTTFYRPRSGITFAGFGVSYRENGAEYYSNNAVGLNRGVPWLYRTTARFEQFNDANDRYFNVMLQTLTIYGNP